MSRRPPPEPRPSVQSDGGLDRHHGEKTLAKLAQQFDVHANQITTWRVQLLEGAAGVFGGDSAAEVAEPVVAAKTLHTKIGELTLANDFLAGALGKAGLLGHRHRRSRPNGHHNEGR
ncbi:putative transposase [Novosphingobium sp. Rr 2-17]|nr:putative transposase [Novosphingobium sp. Rr 2-17]